MSDFVEAIVSLLPAELVEHGNRVVGILSVLRLWRSAVALLFAPLLALFLGCSSGTGIIHDQREGGEGAPIEVLLTSRSGLAGPATGMGTPSSIDFQVEVTNISDADVVVERISVYQPNETTDPYRVTPVFGRYKELIEPGNEHVFELKSSGRQVRILDRGEKSSVVMRVGVSLKSGDQYSFSFEVPVPMQSR